MHCGPHLSHGFPSLVILRIKNLYLERATLDTFLAFFPTLRTISLEKVREYSKLGTGAYAAYPNLSELYLEVQCIDAWAGIMLPNARIIEIGEELFPLLDADDVSRLGRFLKQCSSVTDLKVDITFWNPLQFALLVQTVLSEHTLYPRLRSLSIRVGSAACLQDPERVGWLQHLMRLAQWKSRRRMESANSDHTFVEFSRFQMIMWPHRSSMTTPLPDEEDQESFRIIRDRLSSVGVETVILWSGSPYYFE
ncbi:hypothetical protein D9757_005270 [Collybiopsis confluens]|uniref:Uncharacterized protein n=1 Tax=Collybiopsis confluens TaxID=2823264 RepID=A0A8H5ME72_9AGAR|nr:hypothetical protein D9757_005270 [Collybiopsis confluens]